MNQDDMRALEQQHKRIHCYLMLAVQPCLLRQFEADWNEAETWDAKNRVICAWVQCIADSEMLISVGDDNDAA